MTGGIGVAEVKQGAGGGAGSLDPEILTQVPLHWTWVATVRASSGGASCALRAAFSIRLSRSLPPYAHGQSSPARSAHVFPAGALCLLTVPLCSPWGSGGSSVRHRHLQSDVSLKGFEFASFSAPSVETPHPSASLGASRGQSKDSGIGYHILLHG